jgi:hypothetical protein
MSEMPHADFIQAEQAYRAERYAPTGDEPRMSRWEGWIAFAAVIMAMFGGLYIVAGMVTLFNARYYEVNTAVLALDESWTALGWTQLILGVLVVVAAVGLLRARLWARIAAVVLAGLTIVENFVEMAASPLWNMILIGLAVVAIYAIVVHGRDAASD